MPLGTFVTSAYKRQKYTNSFNSSLVVIKVKSSYKRVVNWIKRRFIKILTPRKKVTI